MVISSGRFEFALERLKPSDWERFEHICSVFLASEFSGIRTMASPGGDRGRDAELYVMSDEPKNLFQYSVTENWRDKIRKTIARLATEFPDVHDVTFLSSQRIGAAGDDVRKEARTAGVRLDIRDRSWFTERVNLDENRQQAAEALAAVIVDPLLAEKGVIAKNVTIAGQDLRTAITFLELQSKDEDSAKGLTKSCFESLIKAALSGTTSGALLTRAQIHQKVYGFLPQHPPTQLANFIDAAIVRLQKGTIKHYRDIDSFHISHGESESISNRLSDLHLLKSRFFEDISEISQLILGDDVHDEEKIRKVIQEVVEAYFYKLGEEFAQAVASDEMPVVQENVLLDVCGTYSPGGKINGDFTWTEFCYAVSSSLMTNAGPKTVEYLRLLSSAYTLFAFLSATPDVQKVTKKLFDHGALWFDTTVLLPIFAERAYPEDMRPFTDLMNQLKRSGLELFVTPGIIEEIERHLNLCKTYLNTTPWDGRVPYVVQRYLLAGKSPTTFVTWLEIFMGSSMPLEDLGDFLFEATGIQVSDVVADDRIPSDVVADVTQYWQTVQDKRRGTRDAFSISANRLATHDIENYLAVLSQRKREVGKSLLGYTSWLVTLDSAAWRLLGKVDENTRRFIRDAPVISLDFLIKYLSFGPRRDQTATADKGHLRIFTSAIFENVSPELMEAAKAVRKSYGVMDERLMQRKIRDELNKQRMKAGTMQNAGLDGMDEALKSMF